MKITAAWPVAVTLVLAGGALPVAGQSLQEALAFVPANASRVEVIRDWAVTTARAKASLERVNGAPTTLMDLVAGLAVKPSLLARGPVVVGVFADPAKKGERKATWVPVKDFAETVRALKGTPVAEGYRVKGQAGTFTLMKHGPFALITQDPGLAKTLAHPGSNLAKELAPLGPWMEAHDWVLVTPETATRTGLAEMQAAMDRDPDKTPQVKFLKAALGPLVKSFAASINHAAVAVDFPADGSCRARARAFFMAGSPLAQAGAAMPVPQVHPLEGLRPAGFLLAMGGPWPSGLNAFAASLTSLTAKDDPAAERRAELQTQAMANCRSQAFTFALPEAAGAPFLGNTRWLISVNDVPAFFHHASDLADLPQPQLEALGLRQGFVENVLPGVPSYTQTFTLAPARADAPAVLPAGQLKFALSMLTGNPDRITLSCARVDEHTVLGLFGDAQALKAALAEYGPGFAKDPRVAAIDALLPGNAPWRFYLDLENTRAFAQTLVDTFAPKPNRQPLPVLPANPPLEAVVTLDAQGLELAAAAAPASMEALGILVHAMAKPKAPEQPAKGPGKKKK